MSTEGGLARVRRLEKEMKEDENEKVEGLSREDGVRCGWGRWVGRGAGV